MAKEFMVIFEGHILIKSDSINHASDILYEKLDKIGVKYILKQVSEVPNG